MASYTIHTQVSSSRPVSRKAEKFSTLPWPYWWSASAGLSETRTESRVMKAAIRSSPECAASERMPRLPVVMPTTTLSAVMAVAASTELNATPRFSTRICAGAGVEVGRSHLTGILRLWCRAPNPDPAPPASRGSLC